MKRKLLITLAMAFVLVCALAFAVSADSVHSGVDKTATVTLANNQVVNLFDAEGNALIWYYDKSGTLQSVRADLGVYDENGELKTDNKVDFRMSTWSSTIYGVYCYQVNGIYMTIGGESYGASDIVVFNIMDDDVKVTTKK